MKPKALLFYFLLAMVWGSSFILMKKALLAFTPLQIGALRMVVAGLVMLPFLLGKASQLSRKDWVFVVAVGIFGNGLPAFLFPMAETHINSASVGMLNSLSPLFTLIIGVLFFRLPFVWTKSIGIILGFVGAAILVLAKDQSVDAMQHVQYAILVVIATIGYGLSTNIMKSFLSELPTLLASGFALVSVAIPYGTYLLIASDISTVFASSPYAWSSFLFIIILGAVGTALALIWYYRLLRLTDPIISSSVAYVIPIVALIWGLIDGEHINGLQFLAMGIILAGVWMANRG
ncbi:MAG: EamA family transporter [Bacteroidota bacterium]